MIIEIDKSHQLNSNPDVVVLGGIPRLIDAHSYALYLMHCVFIYSFVRRVMKNIPVWETGVIIILGSIVATWIGHNLIEVPIKRFFQRNKC